MYVEVAVSGVNDAVVWRLDESSKIYRRTGDSWETIGGELEVITCGHPGVWGVIDEKAYYRVGTYESIET